jgi:predicted ATP-grasp superfamily ATP-dependent carboligase
MAETLVEEFSRLCREYATAEGSEKEEAWNLIADFALENSLKICMALERTFPPVKGAPYHG